MCEKAVPNTTKKLHLCWNGTGLYDWIFFLLCYSWQWMFRLLSASHSWVCQQIFFVFIQVGLSSCFFFYYLFFWWTSFPTKLKLCLISWLYIHCLWPPNLFSFSFWMLLFVMIVISNYPHFKFIWWSQPPHVLGVAIYFTDPSWDGYELWLYEIKGN